MKRKMLSCLASLTLISSVFAEEISMDKEGQWLRPYLISVENFPKPGFNFITYANLLKHPEAFNQAIQVFANRYREKKVDAIVGLDARGFIFGAALAYELKLPFVMVRKAGKLPRETKRIDYALEYGTASFEIEVESIEKGERVIIIDDVLATGGTSVAAAKLLEDLGAEVVEAAFLVEFNFLSGRENFGRPVFSLITL